MGKLGKFLIFVAGIGALFAWATNYRVPEGFEEPWKLKVFFTSMQLTFKLDAVRVFFGLERILWNGFTADNLITPASLTREESHLEGIRTVIYRPVGASDSSPALVYFHGGGWIYGNPEGMHDYTVDLAKDLGIIIFSVDYRLAPKDPYPAAFDDCYKVAEYVVNNARELKVDQKRISVGGDSAGGNLAAAVAMKFRDQGMSDKIKMQLLLYPVLQLHDFQTSSYKENKYDGILRPKFMAGMWLLYGFGEERTHLIQDMADNTHVTEEVRKEFMETCGNSPLLTKTVTKPTNKKAWNELKHLMNDPYFVPLVAKDLTNMSPSVVITAGQDILRDEGFIYAERLRQSGVPVSHQHVKDCMHGIFSFKAVFAKDYQKAYDQVLGDIKKFLL